MTDELAEIKGRIERFGEIKYGKAQSNSQEMLFVDARKLLAIVIAKEKVLQEELKTSTCYWGTLKIVRSILDEPAAMGTLTRINRAVAIINRIIPPNEETT